MPVPTRERRAPGRTGREHAARGPAAPGSMRTPARGYTDGRVGWRASRRYVVTVILLSLGAVIATNLGSLAFDHLRTSLLNANWEFSWSHDADTVLLAVGVCASLLGARRSVTDRRLWTATAVILALFVVDEISAFHGQIGNLEKLLYVPILVALVLCVWRLTTGTREGLLATWGFVTLVVAFGMHVAGLHLLRPIGYTDYLYQAGVGFKEGTELAGLILLVTALWRRAHATRVSSAF
jgi:hypothetical protein